MISRTALALGAALAVAAGGAAAGALDECEAPGRQTDAVARCLTALDLETLAVLKQAEERAAGAARAEDERTHRGNAAYAALAQSARAFALYQSAQCDYVQAMTPGANVRAKTAGPTRADLARIACRIDIARNRIEQLAH